MAVVAEVAGRDVVLVLLVVAAAVVLAAEVVALVVAPVCAAALGVLPALVPQAVASIPIAALAPKPITARRVKRRKVVLSVVVLPPSLPASSHQCSRAPRAR